MGDESTTQSSHRRTSNLTSESTEHPADRAAGRDGELVPGLRHVGHHVQGAARRARRAEAGPPPDHLGHGAAGLPPRPPLRQVRPRLGRHDGPLPPARRWRDLRRTRAHGPAVLAAPPADRLPRQLRQPGLRSRCIPLHGVPAAPAGHAVAGRHRRGHRRSAAQLRRHHRGADGVAVAVPEPARQRQPGHRRGHGHEHPAAQPRRGHRRHHPPDRPPGRHARRPDAVRQGPGLPDRRQHPRPGRDHGRLPHRPGQREDARHGDDRGERPRRHRDRHHRAALPDQLLGDRRPHPGARRRRRPRGHRRRQRRLVGRQDEPRGDPATRRQRQRRAEQAVQADAAADQLRHQHGRPGRRRAAHAEPRAGAGGLRRPPGRGHRPAVTVPPRPGPPARAHPRGADQGPRRDRRDHRPDPGQRRPRGGEGRPDGRAVRVQRGAGDRHPRHAAAPADQAVAHRPGDGAGGRPLDDP